MAVLGADPGQFDFKGPAETASTQMMREWQGRKAAGSAIRPWLWGLEPHFHQTENTDTDKFYFTRLLRDQVCESPF